MKQLHFTHKLAAAATATVIAMQSGQAIATTGFVGMTDKITTSASKLPTLVSSLSYTGGLALAVMGIINIKKHGENPSQHPLKNGVIQVGAAGCFLALPKFTDYAMSSIGDQSTTVDVPAFKTVTF